MYTFRKKLKTLFFEFRFHPLCCFQEFFFGRGAWNSGGGPQERHQETPTGMARPVGGPTKKKKHGKPMENDG